MILTLAISLSSFPLPGDILCFNCLLSVPLPPKPIELLLFQGCCTCCCLCLDFPLVSCTFLLLSVYMREYSFFLLILQLSALILSPLEASQDHPVKRMSTHIVLYYSTLSISFKACLKICNFNDFLFLLIYFRSHSWTVSSVRVDTILIFFIVV